MKVLGYELPVVRHPQVDVSIHPHQAAMLDAWHLHDSFLLVTKTGSGKTAATVLPMALNLKTYNDNSALFVYPTNELIRDQERAIREWLEQRLNRKVRVITPENSVGLVDDSDVELVRIDAKILEHFCEAWKLRTRKGKPDKGRALERLLSTAKPKIVLINPDILYLIYGMRYGKSQSAIAALQAFQTVVFDEFHLYQGVELARVLYLIHAAREFGAFKRVVLLSATPHPEVRRWVDKLLNPFEITMETNTTHTISDMRRVAHDIQLSTLRSGRGKEVGIAQQKIGELLAQIKSLRTARKDDKGYVPCVVILNSVVKAIELEQHLLDSGWLPNQIVPIRGMSDRRVRQLTSDQLLVIGTSAIEVGIDFQCDYLVFEAGDAASFMQRFGRLGRHAPGQAFLIGSERECRAIESLPDEISRSQLEERVALTYENADAKAWFVGTELGAFAAFAQAFNVRRQVFQDRDDGPDVQETKEQIFDALKNMMKVYANKMGIVQQLTQAEKLYWRHARGAGCTWVEDYLKIDTFRCGLPNETVHDRSEELRRGPAFARFEVDVGTILEKAANPVTRGEITFVDGFTERHKIRIAQSFRDGSIAPESLQTTTEHDNVMITRDGGLDSASSIMSRRGVGHVFVFVPKDAVSPDWHMKWFYCRDYQNILAFDGDALLLKEMCKRNKSHV